jgi:hypothetical protein
LTVIVVSFGFFFLRPDLAERAVGEVVEEEVERARRHDEAGDGAKAARGTI